MVQTTFNAVSPTCWTKTFCAAIPNIPSVPIYGDPALYKYSQTSGYVTTVAVEFVATGGVGLIADGFSATVTAAKTLPRLVTELPAVVNEVKSVVKAVVPGVKALVPRLPGLVKTTVTGVADNAASLVKNPGAFLSDLKTGLSNPLTTKGGIFGTPASTTGTAVSETVTPKPMLQIEAPPVRLQIEAPPAVANSTTQLDWSIVKASTGETRFEHVTAHMLPNIDKASHGVFIEDAVTTTNAAWARAQSLGIQPTIAGTVDTYVVPMARSVGFAGGANANELAGVPHMGVQIVTRAGTSQIITSFPVVIP